jgi:hypothetical protein
MKVRTRRLGLIVSIKHRKVLKLSFFISLEEAKKDKKAQ